jgi:hypothetical protein
VRAIAGTAELGATSQAEALGRGTRSVQITSSAIYWITDDRAAQQSLIVAWSPPTAPRILFTPTRAGGNFQFLRASDRWMVWLEQVDGRTWTDARIYAARVGTAERILVDDLTGSGDLVTFPEIAVTGDDVYWTVPRAVSGTWRGELRHRRLGAGAPETIDVADGGVIAWPAVADDMLAYEVSSGPSNPSTIVRYTTSSKTIEIKNASEPAIGAGYVLVKMADRFTSGRLGMVAIGEVIPSEIAPSGEAPRAEGAIAVWANGTALGSIVARPRDLCGAKLFATPNSDGSSESGLTAAGSELAWVVVRPTNGGAQEFVRTAPLLRLRC